MRIQHNLSAMNSLTNYHNNNNSLSNNLEKLSSGYRINSAADDAAGLAISEKMRSQIAGLEKAQDNANDGISLIQTAEGALTEVNSMLTRLKSLATQSANGTYEDGVDRANIQEETDALLSEIDRISKSTNFNGISLLDGSLDGASQVSHVAVDETKAVKGLYETSMAFADGGSDQFAALTKDDIGKTIDYTVTWRNSQGEEKTTTVSLTFQGQGDGTMAAMSSDHSTIDSAGAAAKNYFTDDIGNKYSLSDGSGTTPAGALSKTQIEDAIMAGLKSNEEFAAAFEISKGDGSTFTKNTGITKTATTLDALVFEAKKEGSEGAVLLSTSIKNNTAVADSKITGMNGTGTVTNLRKSSDSLQRFNIDNLSFVNSSATKDEIAAATFEIDGSKFLLVTSDFSDDAMKGLDADVTVLRSKTKVDDDVKAPNHTLRIAEDAKPSASTSTDKTAGTAFSVTDLAALVQKQTGRVVKAEGDLDESIRSNTGADATKGANADTGIRYGDIVFMETDNKLKLHGKQLDLQVGDTNKDYQKVSVKIQDMSSKGLGLKGLDLGNQEGAAKAIDTIQNAVNSVSMQRGQLGALQNRLEHTLNNLDATDQNITAAESQIRDVDMAKEMTQYSKNNILSQAAQSMLAQANSMPQGVLSLLG